MPTALGVKVTAKVQCPLAFRVDEHGVAPPGVALYSPLPTMVGLTEVLSVLVRVTILAALVVATVWDAKVSDAGENVNGRAAVPLAFRTCWLTGALSVMMTAPLIVPLEPSAGEKVTLRVQVAAGVRLRLDVQGVAPVPAAEKSPLVAIVLKVIALALLFFTVRSFGALVVATA